MTASHFPFLVLVSCPEAHWAEEFLFIPFPDILRAMTFQLLTISPVMFYFFAVGRAAFPFLSFIPSALFSSSTLDWFAMMYVYRPMIRQFTIPWAIWSFAYAFRFRAFDTFPVIRIQAPWALLQLIYPFLLFSSSHCHVKGALIPRVCFLPASRNLAYCFLLDFRIFMDMQQLMRCFIAVLNSTSRGCQGMGPGTVTYLLKTHGTESVSHYQGYPGAHCHLFELLTSL
jgi:hypothetical protein